MVSSFLIFIAIRIGKCIQSSMMSVQFGFQSAAFNSIVYIHSIQPNVQHIHLSKCKIQAPFQRKNFYRYQHIQSNGNILKTYELSSASHCEECPKYLRTSTRLSANNHLQLTSNLFSVFSNAIFTFCNGIYSRNQLFRIDLTAAMRAFISCAAEIVVENPFHPKYKPSSNLRRNMYLLMCCFDVPFQQKFTIECASTSNCSQPA